jgi:putative DNA primase/helicase
MAEGVKKSLAQAFTEQIIEQLKDGTAPWQKPWDASPSVAPHNPHSGTVYRGINRVMLSARGFDDPRWMTYKQASEQGYQVKKGSKAAQVVFWSWTDERKALDASGKPVLDEQGKQVKVKIERTRPLMHYYAVFHASQLQMENGADIPPYIAKELSWNPNDQAESILQASGVPISHDQKDRAYYSPMEDEIHLPPRERFANNERYYSTALHELGHATGHPTRMAREFGPFGSEAYAKEELRAEIASWMISQELGVPHDPSQHTAYVGSWIKILENNPYEIMSTCQTAEKIMDYVMNQEKEKPLEVAKPEPVPPQEAVELTTKKTFLNVPYKEKDAAKSAGAKWDGENKMWYAPEGLELSKISSWLPPPEPRQSPVLLPQEEFGKAIRNAGLLLEGPPVMDGVIHRVPVENGKPGSKDGAYCGHADGYPNGWIQNFKEGSQEKWTATGHVLSNQKKMELYAHMDQELVERREKAQQQLKAIHEKAQKRAYAIWMNAGEATSHDYLTGKGVESFGLKTDGKGFLIVPGFDLETGRLQTIQRIGGDGFKQFSSGCPKRGSCFCIPQEFQPDVEEILMAEGYATGASLHMATGKHVAVAFDAGNLLDVAVALREKYPNAKITICADNDHHVKTNIGVEKAKYAAQAVGGRVVIPSLSPQEKKQGLTDFNDIHKARGLQSVARSVNKDNELER